MDTADEKVGKALWPCVYCKDEKRTTTIKEMAIRVTPAATYFYGYC
jgi:hypothetical protein